MKATLSKLTLTASFLLATTLIFSCTASKPAAGGGSKQQSRSDVACSADTGNAISCTEPYNSGTHYCSNGTVKEYGSVSHGGQTYKYVEIGDQIWMAENLNYNVPKSLCYDNKPENCKKYGRLYDFSMVQKICPEGWHLPNETDWEKLVVFAGGNNAGCRLKAKSSWDKNSTDEYGFSAMPGGQVTPSNTGSKVAGFGLAAAMAIGSAKAGSQRLANAAVKDAENNASAIGKTNFKDGSLYGYWWSSTTGTDASKNYYHSMDNKSGNIAKNVSTDKTEMYSVRCVNDSKIQAVTPVTTPENEETPTTVEQEATPEGGETQPATNEESNVE